MKMKTPKYTIYAKSTGMEITPYEKRQEGKPREGRISLRFFRMEGGAPQLRFVSEPWEGFELSRMIDKVSLEGGKQILTHRFEGSGGETVTKLSVEKYERNGKEGHAMTIQRGDDVINVPVALGQFLYAGEFLRRLSVTEAWVEQHDGERRSDTAE
jgi:hypothetical protein